MHWLTKAPQLADLIIDLLPILVHRPALHALIQGLAEALVVADAAGQISRARPPREPILGHDTLGGTEDTRGNVDDGLGLVRPAFRTREEDGGAAGSAKRAQDSLRRRIGLGRPDFERRVDARLAKTEGHKCPADDVSACDESAVVANVVKSHPLRLVARRDKLGKNGVVEDGLRRAPDGEGHAAALALGPEALLTILAYLSLRLDKFGSRIIGRWVPGSQLLAADVRDHRRDSPIFGRL